MTDFDDEALWASMAETLRDVVVPALADGHARLAAVQLVALATWAARRDRAAGPRRAGELAAALDSLGANPLIPGNPGAPPATRAGAALAAAVGRHDGDAQAVRAALRPVLIRHLDEDLAGSAVLEDGFRGRLPGG